MSERTAPEELSDRVAAETVTVKDYLGALSGDYGDDLNRAVRGCRVRLTSGEVRHPLEITSGQLRAEIAHLPAEAHLRGTTSDLIEFVSALIGGGAE